MVRSTADRRVHDECDNNFADCILIAQLSLTYELVQEESLNSFIALRMQAVATIEWQSRFKFWVGIHDAKTKQNM